MLYCIKMPSVLIMINSPLEPQDAHHAWHVPTGVNLQDWCLTVCDATGPPPQRLRSRKTPHEHGSSSIFPCYARHLAHRGCSVRANRTPGWINEGLQGSPRGRENTLSNQRGHCLRELWATGSIPGQLCKWQHPHTEWLLLGSLQLHDSRNFLQVFKKKKVLIKHDEKEELRSWQKCLKADKTIQSPR